MWTGRNEFVKTACYNSNKDTPIIPSSFHSWFLNRIHSEERFPRRRYRYLSLETCAVNVLVISSRSILPVILWTAGFYVSFYFPGPTWNLLVEWDTYLTLTLIYSGGSKGGAPTARPSLRTKMFLISCNFWGNPTNLYAGAPSYGESWIRPCFKIRLNEMMLQFEKSIKRNKKMVYV